MLCDLYSSYYPTKEGNSTMCYGQKLPHEWRNIKAKERAAGAPTYRLSSREPQDCIQEEACSLLRH